MARAVGGIMVARANGVQLRAKGDWTYNDGEPTREAVVGADGVHGFKRVPRTAFIEGAITDTGDVDVRALKRLEGATITLDLANGKTFVLAQAWFAGEGTVSTGEGEIAVRFEGERGEELRAQ